MCWLSAGRYLLSTSPLLAQESGLRVPASRRDNLDARTRCAGADDLNNLRVSAQTTQIPNDHHVSLAARDCDTHGVQARPRRYNAGNFKIFEGGDDLHPVPGGEGLTLSRLLREEVVRGLPGASTSVDDRARGTSHPTRPALDAVIIRGSATTDVACGCWGHPNRPADVSSHPLHPAATATLITSHFRISKVKLYDFTLIELLLRDRQMDSPNWGVC